MPESTSPRRRTSLLFRLLPALYLAYSSTNDFIIPSVSIIRHLSKRDFLWIGTRAPRPCLLKSLKLAVPALFLVTAIIAQVQDDAFMRHKASRTSLFRSRGRRGGCNFVRRRYGCTSNRLSYRLPASLIYFEERNGVLELLSLG